MTKERLKFIIDEYKQIKNNIETLSIDYGICFKECVFVSKLIGIIHHLLNECFSEEQTFAIEEFMFDQTDTNFEDLCKSLNIEN